jgi:lipoyl-dependent peroxiredoxin
VLDLDIRPPTELGGPGGASNPEQLFALGHAACFQSAMSVVGRRMKKDTSDVDEETARKVVDAAHEVCPISIATRGNVEVTRKIV